jgi:hypothetical protein
LFRRFEATKVSLGSGSLARGPRAELRRPTGKVGSKVVYGPLSDGFGSVGDVMRVAEVHARAGQDREWCGYAPCLNGRSDGEGRVGGREKASRWAARSQASLVWRGELGTNFDHRAARECGTQLWSGSRSPEAGN